MEDQKSENVQAERKKSDRLMAFAALGIAVAGIANLLEGKSWLFSGTVSILVFMFAYSITRLARHFSKRRKDSSR